MTDRAELNTLPETRSDLESRIAFFTAHSYVLLPDLLSPEEVQTINAAIDVSREQTPTMWYWRGNPNTNCNLLLSEPTHDRLIRHPEVLALLDRLMGGPYCFEESAIQITEPSEESRPTAWHRDCGHWREHPLHLDYPQLIVYLTDVDESTHCFTISPEPAGGEILDASAQVEQRGTVYFHGRAGSGILLNAAALHGLTRRKTTNQRRILQVYYSHPHRPAIGDNTLVPPRLWRDHPDPEVRRFYSKHNAYSRLVNDAVGSPPCR
jgi:hypothetical protein